MKGKQNTMPKSERDIMKRYVDQALNDLDRFNENMDSIDKKYQETELLFNITMPQERAVVLGLKEFANQLKELVNEYRRKLV